MQHYRRKPLSLTPLHGNLSGDPAVPIKEESAPDASPMADPAALVQQAASILEAEMAAGSQAAQQVSPSVTESMRPSLQAGTEPSSLLNEIHAFIDQFAQVMVQRPLPINGLPSDPIAASVPSAGNGLPLLRSPYPVSVGELANLAFKVHNDSDQPVQVQFLGTDLWSSAGDRIPSSAVTFIPQMLSLAPDEIAEITTGIKVPPETPANTYSGLAMASNLLDVATAIVLEVVPTAQL